MQLNAGGMQIETPGAIISLRRQDLCKRETRLNEWTNTSTTEAPHVALPAIRSIPNIPLVGWPARRGRYVGSQFGNALTSEQPSN